MDEKCWDSYLFTRLYRESENRLPICPHKEHKENMEYYKIGHWKKKKRKNKKQKQNNDFLTKVSFITGVIPIFHKNDK